MLKSWDFWDTLVTRCVARPTDIFKVVEIISGISGYFKERIIAEEKSRKGVIETNLDRIYEYLPYDRDTLNHLKSLEIKVELSLASGIQSNINDFKDNDLIISDMYLNKKILLQIANKCGLNFSHEKVLVSCDYSATKHLGSLFDIASTLHGKIIEHVGDNLHSDIKIPILKGINATYYRDIEFNRLESEWLKQPEDGHFFSGALRAARLSKKSLPPSKSREWDIYTQIIAPVLIQFVEWIFIEAKNKKIKKIYFLSRDGQVLFHIAQKICRARNLDFECRYLYASRQALHLPGHLDIDESESWILDNTSILTLRNVAARTNVNLAAFMNIAATYISKDADANLDLNERKYLKVIIRTPQFSNLLEKAAQDAFKITYDYFQQEGLNSNDHLAIVDVGWTGRIQRSLKNILKKANVSPDIINGYYFSLSDNYVVSEINAINSFLYNPLDKKNKKYIWIDRYRGMIEFFLSADHPSVHGYARSQDNQVVASFKDDAYSGNIDDIKFRQNAIKVFAEKYCNVSALLNRPLFDHNKLAINILQNFLQNPNKADAQVFVGLQHTEQQVESHFIPMVKYLKVHEIVQNGRASIHGLWREGSHALTGSLWFYKLLRLMSSYYSYLKKSAKN